MKFLRVFAAAALLGAASACLCHGPVVAQSTATPSATRTPLSPAVNVIVGTIGSASDVGFFIAHERGYFKAEGLEVKIESLGSATKMMPALATNDLQVASGGLNAGLINAIARDIPLRIVADKGTLVPGSGYQTFLVRKELAGKVREFADLKGLTIASSGGAITTDSVVINKALGRGGLTIRDAKIVDLRFPDMVTALAKGAVDMALIIEPFATRAADQGVAVRWKNADEIAPNLQLAAVFYGPKFMSDQPEAAKRFMLAYVRAVRDYNDEFLKGANKEAIIAILTKYTAIKDPAIYRRIVPPSINPNAELNLVSIKESLDAWVARGTVSNVEVEKLVDTQYLRYAWEQLGRK
jgi:NitT/TauT family transport system substrate-binding protein